MPAYSQSGVSLTDAVLRVDRSCLRIASKSSTGNASTSNAGNTTAGNASAGNTTAGNAPTPPHPTGCTDIVLATPSGLVRLTSSLYEAQSHAYADVVRRLNTGHGGVMWYISHFGLIDSTQGGWGRDVWSGMGVLQQRYTYMYMMEGKLVRGWFVLPRPFSRGQAQRPVWEDRPEPMQFYPAIFAIFPDSMHHRMACLHILIASSKPWWIHESRMVNYSY